MSSFDWGESFRAADLVVSRGKEMVHHEDTYISIAHESGMGCDTNGNPVSVAITLMPEGGDYISIHLSTPQIMKLAQCLVWDLENYGLEQLESGEEEEEEEE
jgi:predicted NACHT family NTPase